MKWPRFRKMVTLLGCVVFCFCVADHRLTAAPITITMTITAYIDGQDLLIITGNTLQWHHLDNAAVGRFFGVNLPTTISTSLDGVPALTLFDWTPDWPAPPPDEIRFEAFSSVFSGLTPAFPSEDVTVDLTLLRARVHPGISILQAATPANNHTLILDFNDDIAGPDFYTAQLTISTLASEVPEPSTSVLFAPALASIGLAMLRRRKQTSVRFNGRMYQMLKQKWCPTAGNAQEGRLLS